jgi:uncharacterized damage-inducible protein DinB
VKDLLIKQTQDAFADSEEMSLLCSVKDLAQTEAEWRLNATTWTIEEILFHVASCKIEYCKQAFGRWASEIPDAFGNIQEMIALATSAHEHVLQCLHHCSEDDLIRPVPTTFHGESGAHLFWVLIMHDISHGAQIRTIRRAYGTRTDYYPVR